MNIRTNSGFLLFSTVLVGICMTAAYSYLLFHTLAEMFSFVIAVSVFFFAWHTHRYSENNLVLTLGVSYLFVGLLDLLHLLAYEGMGVFIGYNANLPIQAWISARYVECCSLFLAVLFHRNRIRLTYILHIYFVVVILIIGSIFYWQIFPDCLLDGSGLTPFKKNSEYFLLLLTCATMVLLVYSRQTVSRKVFYLFLASLSTTVLSGFASTFDTGTYSISNLVSHLLKMVSIYLVFRVVLEEGLKKTFSQIFEELKNNRDALDTANARLASEVASRIQIEKSNSQSLKEKETLLEEIHHRVKNNIQALAGMLKLQSNKSDDVRLKTVLKESQSRVHTMAIVHEKLYSAGNNGDVGIASYFTSIVEPLIQMYLEQPSKVTFNIQAADISIGINKASPLGLVVNELVTNALKHAFPGGRTGFISIQLVRQDEHFELIVQDNGIGMRAGFDWTESDSLGLRLVRTLVENQLDGSISLNTESGTRFTVQFDIDCHDRC